MAGIGGNCGCFGDLLPMTPTEAFIKNILILGLIGWLWFWIREEQIRVRHNFFVALSIALASILFMFVIAPIQHAAASDIPIVIVEPGNDDIVTLDDPTEVPNTNGETPNNGTNTSNENPEPVKPAYEPKKAVSGFAKYAPGIDDGKKLLLFFAPGCEHCQEAAKQMVEMSKKDKDFPKMFIIFMNEEPEKIPEFFEKAGKKITHTVFDVGTFWTVIGMKRDTPGVLYLWNGNEVIFMDGINENAFTPEKLKKALDKETL